MPGMLDRGVGGARCARPSGAVRPLHPHHLPAGGEALPLCGDKGAVPKGREVHSLGCESTHHNLTGEKFTPLAVNIHRHHKPKG
eukprot:6821859-Pyramimonas_sp.AAC.1